MSRKEYVVPSVFTDFGRGAGWRFIFADNIRPQDDAHAPRLSGMTMECDTLPRAPAVPFTDWIRVFLCEEQPERLTLPTVEECRMWARDFIRAVLQRPAWTNADGLGRDEAKCVGHSFEVRTRSAWKRRTSADATWSILHLPPPGRAGKPAQ